MKYLSRNAGNLFIGTLNTWEETIQPLYKKKSYHLLRAAKTVSAYLTAKFMRHATKVFWIRIYGKTNGGFGYSVSETYKTC